MTEHLCVNWLRVASGLTIAIGLVAALASADATDGLWLWLFDLLEWPVDDNPAGFSDEAFALNAVAGGVMVGWATLMYLIVTRRFARGDYELVQPMIISVLAWFVVDSIGSVAADLVGNVVLNAGFLLIFLPPLVTLGRRR